MAETTVESAVADAENAPDRELAQEDANGAAPTANPIVEEEGKPDDSSEPLEVENARSASLDGSETLKEEERNEGEVEVAAVVVVSSSEIVEEEPASAEEDNQTLTMRELLSDLAEEQAVETSKDEENKRDANVSYSPDPDYASTDLINNVSELNEEGRSRQRILTFAARRYAAAIERNPEDHDAYYNWALVLQESADNVDPDSSSTSKDALLEEACRKYDKATRLCPTLQDAFYNWAIAISDRAKIRGRTKQAEELWKEATQKYEKAIQLNWNSPQALNNWGLALQELSAIVPIREKQMIVKNAINKFRAAIELQFDFHRAIYNLGTVLYALAEDTSRIGRPANSKDLSPDELYSQSAIYIAAAHALKPTYSVYRSALKLVRSMLPLPYLKVGYLTAPPLNNPLAPHRDWERAQFVLNHEGIQQVVNAESKALSHSRSGRINGSITSDKALIKIDVADIVSVSPCSDLTLPPGAGLSIDTIHSPFFLVADSWESLDGWLDAIRLVYTIYARGQSDDLAGIITG